VRFNAWINPERFDQLRVAKYQGRLKSIRTMLISRPEVLLGEGAGNVLDFYAQAWALAHFLNEGSNGQYAESLRTLLADAGAGRVRSRLERALRSRGPIATEDRDNVLATVLFEVYFHSDLDAVDLEYQAFINTVVASGSRQLMLEGKSPFGVPAKSAGHP
jgi:hypothetical protein